MRTSIFSIITLTIVASACDVSTQEAAEQREGLLFGLDEGDVRQLHDRYVPEEDIQLTTDRLSAPFNCDLYDDLCEQVGRDQAIEFSLRLVELGLDGASDAEIEAFSDEFLDSAMALHAEDSSAVAPRSSGSWQTINLNSNTRLRVRNGITTPVLGKRQAWTEARSQRRFPSSGWQYSSVDQICADAGTSRQTMSICGGGIPCSVYDVDTSNPTVDCELDDDRAVSTGKHVRKSGGNTSEGWYFYTLTARGHGSLTDVATTVSTWSGAHVREYPSQN